MTRNVEKTTTLYFQESQQFNLQQFEEQPACMSSHIFRTKFIKELNFQQHCQKRIQRRIQQINKMKIQFKQTIFEKFKNNISKNSSNAQQSAGSTQKNQKQILYKGHIIKGQFKRKLINGDVSIKYQNGTQFQGVCKNGRMRIGRFNFKNGYEYWGELEGTKFIGKGTLKCPDGKKITAVWNGQEIVGRAEIQYPTGDVYYGDVNKFMKHGKGYMFFKTGNKYIGNFKNGEINGSGAYYQTNGQMDKGIWRDGQLIETRDEQEDGQQEYFGVNHTIGIQDTIRRKDTIGINDTIGIKDWSGELEEYAGRSNVVFKSEVVKFEMKGTIEG